MLEPSFRLDSVSIQVSWETAPDGSAKPGDPALLAGHWSLPPQLQPMGARYPLDHSDWVRAVMQLGVG